MRDRPDETMLPHERTVVDMLLVGSGEPLPVLRAQLEQSHVVAREFSGSGFFTQFGMPGDVTKVEDPSILELSDVHAELRRIATVSGFILFIRDGVIDFLEGFVYGDEPWPEVPEITRIYYVHHPAQDDASLVECSERDWSFARQRWATPRHD